MKIEIKNNCDNGMVIRVMVAIVDGFHFDITDESCGVRKKVLSHLIPSLKQCIDSKVSRGKIED